ncbi:MAG: glutathione S-transferase family protein [Halioglobus sp.]
MTSSQRLRLFGGTASPYTRKMVSLLRYRQIPYSITWSDPAGALDALGIEKPSPTFHPTVLFEESAGDIEAVCDSTPIIRRLESACTDRSVIPEDPALAFVNYLLEDFGDEWCTKYMFHYRWYPAEDADNAGTLLPLGMDVTLAPDLLQTFKATFSERQIGRLYVVGSNDATAPVIDASYRRFLAAMESLLEKQPYLLGQRPGSGDFALFGQLSQLVGFDPTSRAIAHEVSPRTVAWVLKMEDLCGLEPTAAGWEDIADLREPLLPMLTEIGRVYVPALLANAAAVAAGDKDWEAQIDGSPWTQRTFSYQAKCLQWINEEYRVLPAQDRERVNQLWAGTGCEAILVDS